MIALRTPTLNRFLKQMQSGVIGARRGRNRNTRGAYTSTPIEVFESRVLLTGISADPTADVSTPSDISSSTDFYEIAQESPLGDEFSELDDAYSEYEQSYETMLDEAYSQATTTQEEHSGQQTGSDTGGGNGDDSSTDSDTADDAQAGQETFNGGLNSILSQLLVGGTDADASGTSDASGDSDQETSQNPFALPTSVQFADVSLPAESDYIDLFEVAPVSIDSFSESTTSELTSVPVDENGNELTGSAPTEIIQNVTFQQTYNDDGSWVVHQSVSDTFRDKQSASDAPSDQQAAARTGSQSYSVTVIDGTTTVRTYTQTDTQVFDSRPTAQDEAASSPLSSDSSSSYAIPESWIDDAAGVTEEPDTGDSSSDNSDDSDSNSDSSEDAWGTEDSQGDVTFSNTGLTNTVTETQITLDDGTAAIQTTVSLSWYISYSYADSGEFGGDDTNTEDSDADVPASFNAEISGGYNVFASASVGGHFTVTTVTPVGGTEAIDSLSSTSFGFAITAMAGGGYRSTTHITQDESSGSKADNTDTFEFFDLKDTVEYGGMVGFSFVVAASTEDNESTADNSSGSNSDEAVAVREQVAGEQTAQELLADKKSGVQVSFNTNATSSYETDHTIRTKTRWDFGDADYPDYGYDELIYTDVSSGGNGGHTIIEFGSDAMSIDIGANGNSTKTLNSTSTLWSYGNGASAPDEQIDETINTVSDVSSSDYEYGLKIGGDAGFELVNKSSFDVEVSVVEELLSTFNGERAGYITEEIYVNFSEEESGEEDDTDESAGTDDPEAEERERIHRKTLTFVSAGQDDYIEVLFDNPPQEAPDYGGQESPEDLLASYQANREQLLRLQALLSQTNDPDEIAYLQDQIARQESLLTQITEAAGAAGVSAEQLSTAAEAAQDAFDDAEPPTWTGIGDLGDDDIHSGAPGYWHFVFNPSDLDEGWLQNTQYAALWTAAIAGGIATGGTIYQGGVITAMPTFTYWGASAIIGTVSTAQPILVSTATTLSGTAVLAYRVPTTAWTRASRFFATATSYETLRNSSSVFRFLRNRLPNLNFQMHHWFIANSTANSNGLSNVANAGWNLFPIPGTWNNFIGNGGTFFALTRLGIGVGAPSAVGGATYGTYAAADSFWEWMFGNSTSEDTEQ